MNQIEKSPLINEYELNQEFYFQSLFQEACIKRRLSDTQIERIQIELLELMSKEVERYTNDESSSIPVEKAQELLQSITYSIGFYLKSLPDMTQKLEALKEEKISVLFYKGMEEISLRKKKANELLQYFTNPPFKIDNIAYQDTLLTGIPEFFHDYNIEFGAHSNPGCIDYPLFTTITGFVGVEFIYQYLYCFGLEYNFLKCFSDLAINELLLGFDKASEHLLINIFELVLTNALGCRLLGQKSVELDIRKEEIKWLQDNFEKLEPEELDKRLQEALGQLITELTLIPETVDYINAALPMIAKRLKYNLQTKTLDKLFMSSMKQAVIEEEFLDEGTAIEDSQLRTMIEEIRTYPSITEKVTAIQSSVRSLPDLTELLEECFYTEEYTEVFELLGGLECTMLKKYILKVEGLIDFSDFEPQKDWQKVLLDL